MVDLAQVFPFFLVLVFSLNANGNRYNTFYVLYPLGISSECTLVYKALTPAAELNPLYWWFFVIVLGIYVPGMFSLIQLV